MHNFIKKSSTVLLLLLIVLTPAIVFSGSLDDFLKSATSGIPATPIADAESIFRDNSKAVVVIVTLDNKGDAIAQGSGFILRQDGVIVTNYHVISNAVDIKIKAGDKVMDVEGLIYKDEENDLVILKAKGENLPIVKTGDFEKTNVGEKVYVISSPEGLENTISDGIVSGIREIDEKRKILQITAPISEGSSGGPVFNKYGEVIGVSTFIIQTAQNLNFAMPINLIKDKITDKEIIALKDADIVDYEKTAEYWFYVGVVYGDLGQYQKATDAFQQALKINPDDSDVYNNLGLAYAGLGKYQDAINAFKQAIIINHTHEFAHYNLGNVYKKLGEYQKAIDAYKQVIIIHPNDSDGYNNLGLAYADLSKYQDAINAFKQAITINSVDTYAYNNLGNSYKKLGQYQDAIDAYRQAIRIDPNFASPHNNLCVAYRVSGKYQDAIDACKRAIRIKPDHVYAHYNLGVAYDGLGKYKEAVEAYQQDIKINPDNVGAYLNLGAAYGELGEYQNSADAFKQAISINPNYIEAYYNLGYLYLLKGDKGHALEEYKILKDLDKEQANKLLNLINE